MAINHYLGYQYPDQFTEFNKKSTITHITWLLFWRSVWREDWRCADGTKDIWIVDQWSKTGDEGCFKCSTRSTPREVFKWWEVDARISILLVKLLLIHIIKTGSVDYISILTLAKKDFQTLFYLRNSVSWCTRQVTLDMFHFVSWLLWQMTLQNLSKWMTKSWRVNEKLDLFRFMAKLSTLSKKMRVGANCRARLNSFSMLASVLPTYLPAIVFPCQHSNQMFYSLLKGNNVTNLTVKSGNILSRLEEVWTSLV